MRRRLISAALNYSDDDITIVITRVWRVDTQIQGWTLGDQAESFTFPADNVAAWSDSWEKTRQQLYPLTWVDISDFALMTA